MLWGSDEMCFALCKMMLKCQYIIYLMGFGMHPPVWYWMSVWTQSHLLSLFPGLQILVSSVASLCWLWPHCCWSLLHNPWPWPSAWQCYSSGSPQDWTPPTSPACCSRGCALLMRRVWAKWGFLCPVSSPSMGCCCCAPLDLWCSCWMSQGVCCHSHGRYTAHLAGYGVSSVCAFLPCGFGTTPDETKIKEIHWLVRPLQICSILIWLMEMRFLHNMSPLKIIKMVSFQI